MARQVILAGAMLSFLSKAVCTVRLPLSTNTRYHLPVWRGGGEGGEEKRVRGRERRGEEAGDEVEREGKRHTGTF